jgi:hypothetical protein
VFLVDLCRKAGGDAVALGDQAGTSIRERPGATNLLSSTCAAPSETSWSPTLNDGSPISTSARTLLTDLQLLGIW